MEVVIVGVWLIIFGSLFNNEPSTTVVLADNNKKENSLIIETKNKKTIINEVGQYVDLNKEENIQIKKMTKDEIYKNFKELIDNEPIKPKSILLYFKSGKNELDNESTNKLALILNEIKKRKYPSLNIIGHADTKGEEKYNIKLSLERAKMVKKQILSKNIKIKNIKVESYGENDLLIKTKDNVSEAKNRRVEVLIK